MSRLRAIVEQLESCGYECVAGKLELNTAFIELKEIAHCVEAIYAKEMTREELEDFKRDWSSL